MTNRPRPTSPCVAMLLGASLCALAACAALAQQAGERKKEKGESAASGASTLNSSAVAFFETRVRPLLAEKCFACHGDAVQQGGLRLNTGAGLRKGGASGPVVAPGKPSESLLLRAVGYHDTLKMPPSGKLSEAQIADLTRWVEAGAVWPEQGTAKKGEGEGKGGSQNRNLTLNQASAGGQQLSTLNSYPPDRRNFWSFQPPRAVPPPKVKDAAWVKNPIDAFVLARLEAKGLKPAPAADKRTLIRRATFDLTGLPPTPDEINAFLADRSPDAWAHVVDRLLASPRYGERWGRHWLDVVRYADSYDARGSGSEGDISEAWRYRDWVINAFNRDLPYTDFIKQQIAGDLIEEKKRSKEEEKNTKPEPQATSHDASTLNPDGIIATGLLAIGNWGNGDADKEKILTDIADDQVDVVSRGIMGLTVACARCHDHKFDPIPTKDYYGMAGIFFSSHILPKLAPKGAGESPLRISLETPAEASARAQYARDLTDAEARLKQTRTAQYAAFARSLLPQTARYVTAVGQYAQRPAAQSALTLEQFAQAQGLQGWAMRQWRDALETRGYTPLPHTPRLVDGNAGVFAWRGQPDCPNVLLNRNNEARPIQTFTLPPRSVNIHPGPANGVVVAWRSPFTGRVQVTGAARDADPAGGDGIAWAIDQRDAAGARQLASGEFANGGAQNFAQGQGAGGLQSIAVRQGERLELLVLPKANYICDTTTVEWTITEVKATSATRNLPAPRVWNLAGDLLAEMSKAGVSAAHGDQQGNADVWQFEDMGDRQRGEKSGPDADPDAARLRLALSLPQDTDAQREATRQAIETFARSFHATDASSPFWIRNPAEESALPAPSRDLLAQQTVRLDMLKKNPPPPIRYANGAQEGGCPESPQAGVHDVRVHIRGNYARLGDMVPRHFPIVLAGEQQTPITQGSGRRELAEWLTSPRHPLTARVWVNRVWQHHFGQGIVRTPSNFGFLGERPTHPELLDWLAAHFMEGSGFRGQGSAARSATKGADGRVSSPDPRPLNPDPFACGWSTKKLHRLILLSATYQQSSEARAQTLRTDPDNRLWGRMNRQRLEGEAIRDNLLAVTGRLDTTMGGMAYRDFAVPRRTLYYVSIRSDRSGFGPLFDAADPTASVDRRTISTVAPQALYLLNNAFVVEQCRALAQTLAKECPDDGPARDARRIQRAYMRLYGRNPETAEIGIGLRYLQRARAASGDEAAWQQYAQILLCANEFVYVD